MFPSHSFVSAHLFVHLFLHVLFLLLRHNRCGTDGCEIIHVAIFSDARQVTRLRNEKQLQNKFFNTCKSVNAARFFTLCRLREIGMLLYVFSLLLSTAGGRLFVELLCEDALTPIDWIECSDVILLLLLLSPPVWSSTCLKIDYLKIQKRVPWLRFVLTIGIDSAFRLASVFHKNFLHFTIVQIIQFPHGSLGSLYEVD